MRIFLALPRSAWVDLNLRQTLQAMGHDLVRFEFPGWPDPDDPSWQRHGKPRTNQRLVAAFRQALRTGPVHLFFGYFYSSVVYPDTIDTIRASGVPTVNFSCNNVHQFHLVAEIAAHFEACIVPERAALDQFVRVGARPLRIQLAANPRVYRPYPEPRIYDVTFVGQRYADRAELVDHLYRHGVDVRVWGAGWQRQKRLDTAQARAALALLEDEGLGGVWRVLRAPAARTTESPPHPADTIDTSPYGGPRLLQRDLVRTFSQSHVSLGFATAGNSHTRQNGRLTHLRLREFEAPMSGALYLTEHQAELEDYFRPGTEVLTYTDADDLLEKACWALRHPEAAERIRRAGYQRALRDHTWERRFAELFAALPL